MECKNLIRFNSLPKHDDRDWKLIFAQLLRSSVLCAVFFGLIGLRPVGVVADCINPIALWKLEESGASPEFQNEIKPGSNSGTCRQEDGVSVCPQPEPARYGTGQRFYADGQPTGIDIPSSAIFNWRAKQSFSISFWMKRDNTPPEGNEVIIGRDSKEADNNLHWWIGVQKNGIARAVFLGKDHQSMWTEHKHLRGDKLLTDNRWHYIVFVRNGATFENRLYVDGELEDKEVVAYDAVDALSADSTPLNIGWLNLSQGYYYKGLLDEVALYDTALPQWFIHDRYNADERYLSSQQDPCD